MTQNHVALPCLPVAQQQQLDSCILPLLRPHHILPYHTYCNAKWHVLCCRGTISPHPTGTSSHTIKCESVIVCASLCEDHKLRCRLSLQAACVPSHHKLNGNSSGSKRARMLYTCLETKYKHTYTLSSSRPPSQPAALRLYKMNNTYMRCNLLPFSCTPHSTKQTARNSTVVRHHHQHRHQHQHHRVNTCQSETSDSA